MISLRTLERRLAQAGIDGADLEAQLLLAHAMGVDRAAVLAGGVAPSGPQERELEALVERRLAREPLAYLTRRREFYSIELEVGPGVHVPRPSTEALVEEALRRLPARGVAADVGTGSGNIARALEQNRPDARVFAIDIDTTALEYARRNLRRAEVLQGDLLSPLAGRGIELDLVVCNPPYIAGDEWDWVDPEVRHEPRLALDGGADGLDVIRRLIEQAPRLLKRGGSLVFEVGFRQADFAARLLPSSTYSEVVIRPDAGIPRVVAAVIS